MFELLLSILFIAVFGKLIVLALRLAWGALYVILSVVLLPVIILWALFMGLFKIALPVLIIVGIFAFLAGDKGKTHTV